MTTFTGAVVRIDQETLDMEERYSVPRFPCVFVVVDGIAVISRLPARASAQSSVLVVDLSDGNVLKEIPISAQGSSIAEIDGEIWMTLRETGRVVRIDPISYEFTGRVDLEPLANSVIAAEGSLWVTVSGDNPAIVQIDPGTETVTQTYSTEEIGEPEFIAYADGFLWVSFPEENLLGHFDAETGETLDLIMVDPSPLGVVVGGGDVWVVHPTGSLSRIDGTTHEIVDSISLNGVPQVAFAIGEEIWVPDSAGSGIIRIDPTLDPS